MALNLHAQDAQNIVYVNLSGVQGNGDGSSPANAVGTWKTAYSKLPKYTGTTDEERNAAWDNNIIVVCGQTGNLFINESDTNGGIPATITGVWPWTSDNTTATKVIAGGAVNLNGTTVHPNTTRIGADTRLKYLRIAKSGFICMYLHDLTFDVGCVMTDMADLPTSNGALKIGSVTRKAPEMQVFLFANTYNFDQAKTDGGWPEQTKPVTLTIKSGKFGRILSNRITGTTEALVKQRYVIGNPNHPLMCVVNIDIDPETSTGAWNPKNYPDDIAFLCAGMTQGTEYADVQFNIKRGKIATLVGAMQGNSIAAAEGAGLSNSSFFGRTVTNIQADNVEDVTIYRYYAACFGRYADGQNATTNAAFYGQSILNMYGGKIESGAYVSAGGISGLQSPDGSYHTNDKFIPYLDGTASKNYPFMGIKYQTYDAGKTMPSITTIMNGTPETINLAETITKMNIYDGEIRGGVFGGSYGYSSEMPAARAMAGAGSLWGETNVNIYGGTIYGGIYGGGKGAPNYYNDAAAGSKANFLTVASVYGNTNVNIYGGNIVEGDIYGAGAGVEAAGSVGSDTEFLNIAKVYGTTNVTIQPTDPNWTFNQNIYGGGALGSVEGNTNVTILGGIINGSVFGAGKGENGHPDKAKVTGTTNVTVGNP